ncbi:MAG: glucosidase [Planctomycetaceae bacterium]|nr:glucosidase [Planctomycetaceae bacterium]
MNAEKQRLADAVAKKAPWRKWGPYLSERQWATVREDYSPDGSAWDYFPHEHARSRAYRWGEDGIAGISDSSQQLCLALALWNGLDPFLKERLFGLTNRQGNHGEDVKELYYYLDATPTHSYLKMLYKYPQRRFPYERLVEENARRGRDQGEFELIDTGVFDDDRYFDVFVEYAKASPVDILMLISACNCGERPAAIHVLPQIWFRNTWSWQRGSPTPLITPAGGEAVKADDGRSVYHLHAQGQPQWLFCDNATNARRLYGAEIDGHFKDAFHDYLVAGRHEAVNPARQGTKAAAHYALTVGPGETAVLRLRLSASPLRQPFADFDSLVARRRGEADEFYAELQSPIADADARNVQRQALAGMIWNKQFYHYDVARWLDGDPAQPRPPQCRLCGRNWEWTHLNNADILSMPDTWEYPWYASWDLGFHCIALAMIDPEFAKSQLVLLAREWYMHPNGQLPACEWNFSDVNPPVQAWAAWRVFQIDRRHGAGGPGDLAFLERVFHKLLLNFTWWVNRKDRQERNIFQGGFLGLDNIGVFDRSAPLSGGGFISQADATSWMAMYCLNLMRIALELALHNPVYEDVATKFFEHFLYIAQAMTNMAQTGLGLWDEQDEFYYDVLHHRGGAATLKVRSIVGLIPLLAVETLEPEMLQRLNGFNRRLEWFLCNRPELAALVSRWTEPGRGERRLLSLLRGHRMKCLLRRMLDESEFLSDYGVRSVSRYHLDHPYVFDCSGTRMELHYEGGESEGGLFGGNSNWRGPVWMSVNFLIIEAMQKFHHYYGDDFKVECPTGSGQLITINQVAEELTARLTRLFLRGRDGQRPIFGPCQKMQRDPRFRDCLLFHEYFHGDSGHGLGASHQTGWTGLIAKLLQPRRSPE